MIGWSMPGSIGIVVVVWGNAAWLISAACGVVLTPKLTTAAINGRRDVLRAFMDLLLSMMFS